MVAVDMSKTDSLGTGTVCDSVGKRQQNVESVLNFVCLVSALDTDHRIKLARSTKNLHSIAGEITPKNVLMRP